MSRTLTYYCRSGLLGRCFNPKSKHFHRWGGRGITVCSRWRDSFASFLEDMGEKPHGMSIDRIDNDGHYSCGKCPECIKKGWPANCRWADYITQGNNRGNNKWVLFKGRWITRTALGRKFGVRCGAVTDYIESGKTGEELEAALIKGGKRGALLRAARVKNH